MVILASESPRRRELLAQIINDFEVRSADIDEISAAADPFAVPELNARAKAACVAQKNPDALVIGADTVIIFENKVIGKPRDPDDARRILKAFAGKTHFTVTGVALRRIGKTPLDISYCEVSEVKFKQYTDNTIDRYLSLVHVLDKAGAYALQEHPELIIESYSGEAENIIGLPLLRLKRELDSIM